MTRSASFTLALCLGLTTAASLSAQQSRAEINAAIPHVIRFGGVLKDIDGKPAHGTVRVTFAFYKEEQGGEPLWTETQRVTFDASGRYSVMLGATMSDGLPQALFQTGDAWWIETRVAGAEDDEGGLAFAAASTPRSLLAAVPYALKSVDADKLAGREASDFVTQEQLATLAAQGELSGTGSQGGTPNAGGAVTGSGTAGTVPIWTGTLTQGNSEITQVGSDIGINEATPAATLDVNGTATFRGATTLPALGTATAAAGFRSQLLDFTGSAWSTTTNAPVAQSWRLYAAESGNNTTNPQSTLNFQFQNGAGAATPIVLSIAQTGVISFAPSQTFPGTIKSVTATSPLKASTTSGATALSLDTTALNNTLNGEYAQLNANNAFSGVQLFNNFVGIGEQYPFYPLHVDGTIRSENGGLSLGGFAPLTIDSNGVYGGRFAVLSNGLVGINNANPQANLDVGGSINASGSLTAVGVNVFGNASVSGNLSIAGDTPMSAAPHMYLTGFVPGPLGANTWTQAIFTIPSRNIVITRLTSSGFNTCPNSGPLPFYVYTSPGGFIAELDLSGTGAVSDSGPISIRIAAGTQLFGEIYTPDCGSFGTAPSNIPVSMEYVMQ